MTAAAQEQADQRLTLDSLLFVLRRRYNLLQLQAEVIMQNGSVVRRTRKMHSDVWQFRWREKTADGKKIYRQRTVRVCEVLLKWKEQSIYRWSEDWVFASRHSPGAQPYWGQPI